MKFKFMSLGNWFKTEFKTKNDDFKQITINCLILGALLMLSMLWVGFSYLTLVVAIIFALTKWNGRNLYYVVFLLPLISIFKSQKSDFYYLAYVIIVICMVLGIKLLIDIFKNKTKKINWIFTSLVGLLALYFIARANFSNLSMLLSLLLGLGLLFICYYYKEDINFKELILLFTLGIIFTTLIGLIFYNNERLLSFLELFYAYGRRRFQGANSHVNVYAFELMIALGGMLMLKLRKQITYSIYPIFILFCGALMFTYSKSAIIMSIVAVILYIIFMLIYNLKNKKGLIRGAASVLAMVLSLTLLCVTFKTQYNICRARFVTSIDIIVPEPEPGQDGSSSLNSMNSQNNSKPSVQIDYTELTTGRFDIWKTYFNKITETHKSLLFGYGVGHEIDGEWVMYAGTSTHNTVIQAVYYCGVFGLALMGATLLASINWKKFKFKNYHADGLLLFAITGFGLMGLDFFSFRLGAYLMLIFFAFVKDEEAGEEICVPKSGTQNNSKKKVLNILASNKYSGAENVACQIIDMFGDEYEFAYASLDGPIRESLKERNIKFLALNKKSVSEVKRVINEYKPDIIHAHDVMAITLASLATKNIPIVAHIHNKHVDFKKFSIRSVLFRIIAGFKNIKSIIWVAESSFNDYVYHNHKTIKNKSIILNNIINLEKLKEKAERAELKAGADLVYLGRLAYPKNPERLVEIVSLIKKEIPNISLAVIGDGDLKEKCENLSKELKTDENIKFYGFQSNGYKIVDNSKIFIMTSETEGNPMCVIEAQCFGLPIVSTNIDELKTLVKQGETGFMYNSNEEAAEIIVKLLQNTKAYASMRQKVQDFSKEYNNIEKYKSILRDIYKN